MQNYISKPQCKMQNAKIKMQNYISKPQSKIQNAKFKIHNYYISFED